MIHPFLRALFLFLLAVPMVAIYLPGHYGSATMIPALMLVLYYRKQLDIGRDAMRLYVFFVLFLLLFSILSIDPKSSAKGAYDMIRGSWFFFIGLLFVKNSRSTIDSLFLAVPATLLLLGMFFFPHRGAFYGYFTNPSVNAILISVYLVFLLPYQDGKRNPWVMGVFVLGVVSAGILLLMTNSRSTWLGVVMGLLVLIWTSKRWTAITKMAFTGLPLGALAVVMFFFNHKGLKLHFRDEIWQTLVVNTTEHSPWFGFGLNNAKELLLMEKIPALMTHNLLVDLYVSTGIVGVSMAGYWCYQLARHLVREPLQRDAYFYSGLFGVSVFLTVSMFDLKLASMNFMASMSLFVAFLYAQRKPVTLENSS